MGAIPHGAVRPTQLGHGRGLVELLLLCLALAALVVGTVWLPYLFPTSQRGDMSSDVGFNNSIAYAWYISFLIVPGLVLARMLPGMAVRTGVLFDRVKPAFSLPLFIAAAAGHVLLFGSLFAIKGRLIFSEGLYFQSLMHRIAQGEQPYVDFSYYYGPSMIYPAVLLAQAVSLEAAYAFVYVATYVVGLFFLYVLLASLLGSRRVAGWWFIVLAVGLFNPMTGLNFTFVRHLLPSIAFLLTFDLLRDGGWRRFSATCALVAFALLYSFEVAALVTGAVALAAIVLWARVPLAVLFRVIARAIREEPSDLPLGSPYRRALWRLPALLAFSTALAVIALLAPDLAGGALRGFSDAPIAYLSGAQNEPIYPHVMFLTLVALSVFAVAGTLRLAARAPGSAPLYLGYLGLALATQRVSFSVSDTNHIIFYSLPTLLLCLHLTTQWSWGALARRWLLVVVVFGYVVPLQIYHAGQLGLLPQAGGTDEQASRDSMQGSGMVQAAITDAVLQVGRDRPYVMYGLTYYSVPVYRQLGLRYGNYDTDFVSARTPSLISRMIDDVRSSGAYVVIRKAELEGGLPQPSRDEVWNAVSLVTGVPLPGSEPYLLFHGSRARLRAPFVEYLRQEYRPVHESNGIVVLAPIGR